jgi:hypothetical protein
MPPGTGIEAAAVEVRSTSGYLPLIIMVYPMPVAEQ